MHFSLKHKLCDICGKPRGIHYNHDACAKVRQAQHADDKRPSVDKRPKEIYTSPRLLGQFLKSIGD